MIFPDLRFRVPAGWDRYRARLLEAFPEEREPLGSVVDIPRKVAESGQRFLNGEPKPDGAPGAPAAMTWGLRPITDLLAEYRLSQRAAAVLLGEQGTCAVPPSRTPTLLVAGITDHFMRGAFYPDGGGQVIAGRLIEAIRAYG